jgi:undecaprenyl-diphosphatase
VILLVGERLFRDRGRHARYKTIDAVTPLGAFAIGSSQILALFAGISRSGVTMVTGLMDGLDHEESANFAFLLATPVILLAGLYKLPQLLGPVGDGVRLQTLVGALCAMVAAYVAVRFLTRWFTTKTLFPFGVYSLVVGLLCVVRFA